MNANSFRVGWTTTSLFDGDEVGSIHFSVTMRHAQPGVSESFLNALSKAVEEVLVSTISVDLLKPV